MRTRDSLLLLSTLLLLGFAPLTADAVEVKLQSGANYVQFQQLEGEGDLERTLGNALPSGTSWEGASRIVTADGGPTRAAWFDRDRGSWRGNLRRLHPGRAYWIVLPPGAGPVTVSIPATLTRAGYVPIARGGVLLTPQGDGSMRVDTLDAPPSSSSGYSVVDSAVTIMTATSSVFVQKPDPSGFPAPGSTAVAPGVSNPPMGWVKVKLDTAWAKLGAEEMWVPVQGAGSVVTVPAPDFSRPPWGDRPAPVDER